MEKYPDKADLLLKYLERYYGKDERRRESLNPLISKLNLLSVTDFNRSEIRQLDSLNMLTFSHDTRFSL